MVAVASSANISRMNGPGRADLADAVAGHRHNRRWSQKSTAMRAGFSAGTLKNVENKRTDLLPTTLIGIDNAFGWAPGTAEAILVDRAPVPALPSRQPVAAGGIPRRLLVELDGQEVLEVRTITTGHKDTKLIITLVGDGDADLDEIREAIAQLDDLERKFRGNRD